MRNIFYKHTNTTIALLLFLQIVHISQPLQAKTRPSKQTSRAWLFKRAQNLDDGMNISWLEQTWRNHILDDSTITDNDFVLLKKLGFKTIRLPVAFNYFENKRVPLTQVLIKITQIWNECKMHNMSLIIDYHAGNLKNDN